MFNYTISYYSVSYIFSESFKMFLKTKIPKGRTCLPLRESKSFVARQTARIKEYVYIRSIHILCNPGVFSDSVVKPLSSGYLHRQCRSSLCCLSANRRRSVKHCTGHRESRCKNHQSGRRIEDCGKSIVNNGS